MFFIKRIPLSKPDEALKADDRTDDGFVKYVRSDQSSRN